MYVRAGRGERRMGEILEELSRGLSHEHRDHGVAVASEGILSGTCNRMYIYMCTHTRQLCSIGLWALLTLRG